MSHSVRIDAHHHLWRYTPAEYGWIEESMAALRRDFEVKDLQGEMKAANVHAAVAVQARQTQQETEWLLQCAEQSDQIAGVVGWAPLSDKGFANVLAQYATHEKFVGLRHIVQGEVEGFLDGREFNEGIRALTEEDLTYDVLVYAQQLQEVIHFVDRHPNQRFVVDHCAKPHIRDGEIEPWSGQIAALAKRENVWCKISGLVTEANWNAWSLDTLWPYLTTVLDAFGPRRCMAGSDWPVLLVASSYSRWWQLLEDFAAELSDTERNALLGESARSFYRLKIADLQEAA